MNFFFKISLTVLLITLATPAAMVLARPLLFVETLAVRLQLNGNLECWDSLLELKSCTGEVILFFLNGEAHLGPSCCRAIGIIEHKCWPAMLTSLGFTLEEGDILRGYCDATGTTAPPPLVALSPTKAIFEGILP